MTLEQQVCSLELAKKLKELGVKQESLFWWKKKGRKNSKNGYIYELIGENYPDGGGYDNCEHYSGDKKDISAFTVAELGEMLPKQIEYKVSDYGDRAGYRSLDLKCGKTIINDGWYVLYSDPHPSNLVPVYGTYETTEADARAKMLIYLLENKLITL